MTIEEKASLLSGFDFWQSKEVKRLEIPCFSMADGPHGVRKQVGEGDQLGLNPSKPATCFPTAATVANSWDEKLVEQIGETLGDEANAQNVNMLLGPGVNIKRSPLCGRNFEYYSEDPYLAGKMAAGFIRGFQSKGGATTPKHFAANSQEYLRMSSDSVLDERTLREIYLTAFEIAIKEGKSKGIMSSYNKINGTYANENEHLLQEILRDEWGFQGIVVSDWGGSNDHVDGVRAGAHLEMPTTGTDSDRELVRAVKEGLLSEELLDRRVDEFLTVAFDISKTADGNGKFDETIHHKIAQKAAEASIVLLKNEDKILPLGQNTKVAVIGDFAKNPRYQGAGSSVVNCTKLDNTIDCMQIVPLDMVGYAQGYIRTGEENDTLREEAVALAKKAEVVLLYIGLDEISESEGLDRAHLRIPGNQISLLSAVCSVNKNVIAVMSGGASIEMPWADSCKAIVHGYLSGQAGALAMLRILTGEVCPSGKLSETYAYHFEDMPNASSFPGKERLAEYREGIFVGYRYYDTAEIAVRYPFGFGLSYTSFSYSDLKITPEEVAFTLTNTGAVEGAEIAQLYISALNSQMFRAKKELKGFQKVFLKPGESRRLSIKLDDKAFRYFNVLTNQFEIESGAYELCVGASSQDIRLKDVCQIQGTMAPIPYSKEMLPSYYSGHVTNVSDEEFKRLLGREIPDALWDRTKPLGREDMISQMFYAKSGLARFVYKVLTDIKDRSIAKGKPDLNILFIYHMPFRGIAKMTGGAVNMEMVDALLVVINGHFFKGIVQLFGAMNRMKKANKDTRKKLAEAGK